MYCFTNKGLYVREVCCGETDVKFIYIIYFRDLMCNSDIGSLFCYFFFSRIHWWELKVDWGHASSFMVFDRSISLSAPVIQNVIHLLSWNSCFFQKKNWVIVPEKAYCVNFSSKLFTLCLGKPDVQLLIPENRVEKVPVNISCKMKISQNAFSSSGRSMNNGWWWKCWIATTVIFLYGPSGFCFTS